MSPSRGPVRGNGGQPWTASHHYSGDTGWFDALPGEVNGSDLFLCECTQVQREFEYHLSFEELSARNGDFDCGRLVLTHLGEEMRARGDWGGFEVADDGRVVKL